MTDNDIIKALKCCFNNDWNKTKCNECPFYNGGGSCVDELKKSIFDLINRQKAEIERLKFENLALSQKRITMFERIDIVDNETKKTIREFSDKLKERAHNLPEYGEGGWECRISVVEVEDIDKLVKEMTEGDNG